MASPSRTERRRNCSCIPAGMHVMRRISGVASPSSSRSLTPPGSSQGWPASYPSGNWKKKALLCGVSYTGKRYELKGTVNDVDYMKYFLTTEFDYQESSILVLTGKPFC